MKRTTIEGFVIDEYEHALDLRPWREPNGAWTTTILRVELAQTRARYRYMFLEISVTGLRASEPGMLSGHEAVGRRPVAQVPMTPELAAIRAERTKARRVSHAQLGELVLERDLGWFAVRRGGCNVSISVSDPDDGAIVAGAIESGAPRVLAVEADLEALREAATASLYPIYVAEWCDGAPCTADDFRRALQLSSINVTDRVDVIFECGALFAGHAVEVRIGPQGEVREVCLA